jgi:hypothetical protein
VTPEQHRGASIAYSAYAEFRDFKAHDGSSLPLYQDMEPGIQEGWYRAYLFSARNGVRKARSRLARLEDELSAELCDKEPDL